MIVDQRDGGIVVIDYFKHWTAFILKDVHVVKVDMGDLQLWWSSTDFIARV